MNSILILAFSLGQAFAATQASEAMTKIDAERLEQLTQTLEARVGEEDKAQDGATIILERTIASEHQESIER